MTPSTIPHSVDAITHAIESFVHKMNDAYRTQSYETLSDIIYYYLGHRHAHNMTQTGKFMEASSVKHLIDNKEPNFFEALKACCYKYNLHEDMANVNSSYLSSASVLATFEAHKNQQTMPWVVNINHFNLLSYDKKSILMFCARHYKPEVVLTGEIMGKQHAINFLINLLDDTTAYPKITFSNCDINKMGPQERELLMKTMGSTPKLEISWVDLDRWTADDWKHFVRGVKAHENLESLSLVHTNLKKCFEDPRKFKYFLRLLEIPSLKKLNLNENHLSSLPAEQSQMLTQAMATSSTEVEGIKSHKSKASAANNGMFAEPVKAPPLAITESPGWVI